MAKTLKAEAIVKANRNNNYIYDANPNGYHNA